jgi:6-phosphogluconolactonase (cycloisomerase 2 family)
MRIKPAKQFVAPAAVLAILLSLAGCMTGPGNISILPPGCTANCPPPPAFLYATSTDHIVAFTINQSTGALSAPLTMPGPNQSIGLTASVTLGHLYVSDFLNDTVDGFSINSATGGLTAITGSPYSLGGTPPGAGGLSSFVEAGAYMYATDLNGDGIAGFAYDSGSGKLTPIPGSPFPAGSTPVQAAQAGPQGKFLYVSNLNDPAGGISAFTIDFNTGALTPIPGSPFPTGAAGSYPGPSVLVVGGSADGGNLLYVALTGTSTVNSKIAGFSIDANTGSLTALPGSPFATGNGPESLALVPVTAVGGQEFLYAANGQDNTISAFVVDGSSGNLTPVSGSPYAAGTSLAGLAVSALNTSLGSFFLYAADNQGRTVLAYTIDGNTGALSPIAGSPFSAGSSPVWLTVAVP